MGRSRTYITVIAVAAAAMTAVIASQMLAEAQTSKPPRITSGPTITSTPRVDSDGDGSVDTYGPTDVIEIEIRLSELVCGTGGISLTLRTGNGPVSLREADYSGCGGDHNSVYFDYLVTSDDVDGDGLSIAANSISLRGDNGIIPDTAHDEVPPDPNHRIDGGGPDLTPPRFRGPPGIFVEPSVGDTYTRGEGIRLEADFSEDVVVTTRGGLPTLALAIGDEIRRAEYAESESDNRRLVFVYTVQPDDRDDEGICVPASREGNGAGLIVPAESSITDMVGNDAILLWSVTACRNVEVDGSIVKLPDLAVLAFSATARLGPTHSEGRCLRTGEAVQYVTVIEAEVANVGPGIAGPFTIAINEDPLRQMQRLGAGESLTIAESLVYDPAGRSIQITVDAYGDVEEIKEVSNNTASVRASLPASPLTCTPTPTHTPVPPSPTVTPTPVPPSPTPTYTLGTTLSYTPTPTPALPSPTATVPSSPTAPATPMLSTSTSESSTHTRVTEDQCRRFDLSLEEQQKYLCLFGKRYSLDAADILLALVGMLVTIVCSVVGIVMARRWKTPANQQ